MVMGETTKGIDIALYNRKGEKQPFELIDRLAVDTPEAGTKAIYTYGEAVENASYDLNFAEGNQKITLDNGELLREFTIKKPENLIPENIPIGISIAGIDGTLYASKFDPRDELLKYFVFSLDVNTETIILYKILYDKIYEETGNYDVNIPDKIGNFSVMINNLAGGEE